MRLETPCLRLQHVPADALDISRSENVCGERLTLDQLDHPIPDALVDNRVQPSSHVLAVAVADRLDE